MTEIEHMRMQGWTVGEIAEVYGTTAHVIVKGLIQAEFEEKY